MDLLNRLKSVKRPSLPSAGEPAEKTPAPPSFLAVRTSGPLTLKPSDGSPQNTAAPAESGGVPIPPVWLLALGIALTAWIGWVVYSAADRGVDAGLGVFVAWPALLAMAAIVTAPFAAIAVLLRRTFSGR